MKHQIEQLIDRLADKTLSFGCKLRCIKAINEVDAGDIMTFLARGKNSAGALGFGQEEYIALKNETAGKRSPGDKVVLIEARVLTMYYEPIGHPILIGDVLQKLERGLNFFGEVTRLADWWGANDRPFTSSLQEIFGRAEWKSELQQSNPIRKHIVGTRVTSIQVPKDPAVRSLFEFLLQLKI